MAASNKTPIWDCGSSLYDSFELKSFERQLDSAIASRSLSMPHLPDRRILIPSSNSQQQQEQQQTQPISKKSSKISRSFQKLLKSLFRQKQNNSPLFSGHKQSIGDGFYVIYDKSGALTTIPEGPECDNLSPEIKSLVRRTGSERFTVASIGISCA
nr:Avr9/Cf-9 rapidly elicited protein 194 [Nicotiana tabacum]